MGKVPPSRRVQSHDIASKGGMRGIEGQDFVLGAAQLQAGGQYHFHQFLGEGARTVP